MGTEAAYWAMHGNGLLPWGLALLGTEEVPCTWSSVGSRPLAAAANSEGDPALCLLPDAGSVLLGPGGGSEWRCLLSCISLHPLSPPVG